MRYLLFILLLIPGWMFGKTYDCFPFFNELELLKIRLYELNDVVDHFVLVESIETQRGTAKPLYFENNKGMFTPFLHKIIHVVIDEEHPEFGLWERENYQRNAIMRGLEHCGEDDIILISDLDEIPRADLIHRVGYMLNKYSMPFIGFEMEMFRFHLNRRDPVINRWWGTVAMTYQTLREKNPQHFRDRREKALGFREAGWHFTWMGDRDRIRMKMVSVVEGCDDASFLTDQAVDDWVNSVPAHAIDDRYPLYIRTHEQELKELGFIANY